jgi:hypothetical protein
MREGNGEPDSNKTEDLKLVAKLYDICIQIRIDSNFTFLPQDTTASILGWVLLTYFPPA